MKLETALEYGPNDTTEDGPSQSDFTEAEWKELNTPPTFWKHRPELNTVHGQALIWVVCAACGGNGHIGNPPADCPRCSGSGGWWE